MTGPLVENFSKLQCGGNNLVSSNLNKMKTIKMAFVLSCDRRGYPTLREMPRNHKEHVLANYKSLLFLISRILLEY